MGDAASAAEDEGEWITEESYVVCDIPTTVSRKILEKAQVIRLIGFDKEHPIIQIDNRCFEGTFCQNTIGTQMLLSMYEDENGNISGEHFLNVTKKMKFTEVVLKQRNGASSPKKATEKRPADQEPTSEDDVVESHSDKRLKEAEADENSTASPTSNT